MSFRLIQWKNDHYINRDHIISLEQKQHKIFLTLQGKESCLVLNCANERLAREHFKILLMEIKDSNLQDKIEAQNQQITALQEQINELYNELYYRPNGLGFEQAKEHFETCQSSSHSELPLG